MSSRRAVELVAVCRATGTAIGITDNERKLAVFLPTIGAKAYQLLSSPTVPAILEEKSYDDLIKTMSEHNDLLFSEIVQR